MRAVIAGIVASVALGGAAQAASSYANVSHTSAALTAYDAPGILRHRDVVEFFRLTVWARPEQHHGVTTDYMLRHIAIDCLLRRAKTYADVLYRWSPPHRSSAAIPTGSMKVSPRYRSRSMSPF